MTAGTVDLLDEICPGVIGNPWIPDDSFPHARQLDFLQASLEGALATDPDDVYEALFGGAAGGGKSHAVLMAAAQMAWLYPGSATVIIRRTMPELEQANGLLFNAIQWWAHLDGITYNGQRHAFSFPNRSSVQFGYHHHQKHDAKYHGGEYQLVIFDELTFFPDSHAWLHLRSRMRRPKNSGWPLRLLATSNPGGPGHEWVKRRFVGGKDEVTGEEIRPDYPYFPSKIRDNPTLDGRAYERTLHHLRPARRRQLLDGDWSAKEPGQYYRAEWFGPLLDPENRWADSICARVRSWDLAAGTEERHSKTASVLMARAVFGCRAVEHHRAFRKTPGERDAEIIKQAKLDGPTVVQHFEVEGGSGGIAQVLTLEQRLRREVGCRVSYARPKSEQTPKEQQRVLANPAASGGKLRRAEQPSACLYRGHVLRGESEDETEEGFGTEAGRDPSGQSDGIRLYAGHWTQGLLDALEPFPVMPEGNSTRIINADSADAFNGAWDYLEAHPPRRSGSPLPRSTHRREVSPMTDRVGRILP